MAASPSQADLDALARQQIPGYSSLARLSVSLLAGYPSLAPAGSQVLVVGCGTGAELREAQSIRPDWALTGVDPDRLQFVTQTTLSVDDTEEVISALRKRFPKINGPRKDDICYATQNRQDAVKALAKESELILVVGSKNSSNSNRLRELAERLGTRAFLIDRADEVEKDWLRGVKKVGVTSGASAPEVLVQAVIQRLEEAGGQFQGEIKVAEETVEFSLPKALR